MPRLIHSQTESKLEIKTIACYIHHVYPSFVTGAKNQMKMKMEKKRKEKKRKEKKRTNSSIHQFRVLFCSL